MNALPRFALQQLLHQLRRRRRARGLGIDQLLAQHQVTVQALNKALAGSLLASVGFSNSLG